MSKNSPDGGGVYATFVTWTKSHAPRSQGKVKVLPTSLFRVTVLGCPGGWEWRDQRLVINVGYFTYLYLINK